MADIYDWSTTPATNASADSAINWAEGMDPDQVNDSARQMMARVAEVLDDIAPTRSSAGSSNAYTVTSAAVASGSYNDGEIVSFIVDRANTSSATLNVNGRGAVAFRPEVGREFAAGELRANQPIIAFYRSTSNEFLAVGSGYHVNAMTSGVLTQSVVGRLIGIGTPVLSISATVAPGYIRLTQTTQTLNKADWPELSSWLSTRSYPWGSTSTTFSLPPAAGYFLRFAATSSSIDTSGARTAGSTQSDQNKSHTHGASASSAVSDPGHGHVLQGFQYGVGSGGAGSFGTDANGSASNNGSVTSNTTGITVATTVNVNNTGSGGDEVRTKNVAMHVDIFASAALATGTLGQFGFSYAFDTSTTSSNPGSGVVRLNNATLASATEIYISETDGWGVDISGFLSTIQSGVRLRLSKLGAQNSTVLFTASGSATDNGTWRTIPGAVTVSSGSFSASDTLAFEQFSGAAGAAGPGIDWQGAWLTATAYALADGVSNGGSSYICTSAHTSGAGTEPGVGASWATVWDVIAAKGASGAGSGDLVAANNLSDVANAATAFGNIKQSASETATGVVELATDAETVTGTSTVLATHPSGVKAAIDAAALTFKTIAVSGQSDVVADSRTDTLTLVGVNIAITTNASTDTITFTGSASVPYNHLSGLTLSRNSGTPTTKIDMAIGQAADSTNALLISTSGVLTADCTTTGANGLDTGALANNTWYHVFLIALAAGATPAILVSTSASAPTMPGSYIYKRRIGSVRTNGSAQFTAFTQDGDYFAWAVPVADVSTTNPLTAAVTPTLTVPTGVNVHAILNIHLQASSAAARVIVSDIAMTDALPTTGATTPGATTGGNNAQDGRVGPVTVRTNTSAQVRYRCDSSDASTRVDIVTLGWWDYRGK